MIYLDDLIDMNEEFLQDVKDGRILEVVEEPRAILDYADPTELLNDSLSKYDVETIFWSYFKDFTKTNLYDDYYIKKNYPLYVIAPDLYNSISFWRKAQYT